MPEETGHGGRIKLSTGTAMLLGYVKRTGHLKMASTLWTKIHEWSLRQTERLKGIDPQMNIQMRNDKLLTQMPGEIEHLVKCRCNQKCTLDKIANTLQDVRKITKIGKYSQYKNIILKEKKNFRVYSKDKPKETMAEVTKKKNSCHNCGSKDNYSNNWLKAKKKVYTIENIPEEESPTKDSESDSMGDSIREQFDDDQDPREECLVDTMRKQNWKFKT
ncbi:hypothetical protein O181_083015 [Austropuccinia psidii MF-1]|uniref:Uncharacterized protein n=1 Tax=Austropuccinia psidii MF-1 TaxID=1389203 RepID=A0A9Q3FMB6_9BASI|nr:hypothetical protein [Austropuccinia psidii MF-1]